MTDYRGLLRIGFASVIVLLVALSALYVRNYYSDLPDCVPVPQVSFDPARWKQRVLKIRGGMIEALKTPGFLLKKSREEIIVMLGEPDEKTGNSFTYFFYSYEKKCGAKEEMLIMNFDPKTGKTGRVFTSDQEAAGGIQAR